MSLTPIQHTLATPTFENERRQDPMEVLPRDMMMKVFSYLKPQELGRCFQISRKWKYLASDNEPWKAMSPPTIAFGQKQWEIYFGDVGAEPPLPLNIHQILKSPCPFWPDKKVEETHLLVLVPTTVNGKPLTLTSLGELVKSPKKGHATQYRHFDIGEYTDVPAPKAHWVLMTDDVLPGSRNKTYADQQAVVASYAQKSQAPYQVPHILDAAVAIWMHYVTTGIHLYSDKPWTYTRCQEKYNADWLLAVGGFSPAGLVAYINYDYAFSLGVGGSRKFSDRA